MRVRTGTSYQKPIGLQAFVRWTCTEALVQQCSFRTVTADAERQPNPMPTDKTAERESDTGRVEAWLFTGLWPRAPVPLSSHTRITEPRGTKGIHEGPPQTRGIRQQIAHDLGSVQPNEAPHLRKTEVEN